MQPILICMVLGLMGGAGLAIATEQAPVATPAVAVLTKYQDRLRGADRDGDGAISRTEAQHAQLQRLVDAFERLDADQDGRLTPAEIRQLARGRVFS